METQSKPLTSDRRWISLVNSSSAMPPLVDGFLNLPVSSNIMVPELLSVILPKGISINILIASRISCHSIRVSVGIVSSFQQPSKVNLLTSNKVASKICKHMA